jgi:hypothetical protein
MYIKQFKTEDLNRVKVGKNNNTYNRREAYTIYYFSVWIHPSYYLCIYSEGFVPNCKEDIGMFIVDHRGIQEDEESSTISDEADEKISLSEGPSLKVKAFLNQLESKDPDLELTEIEEDVGMDCTSTHPSIVF